MLTATVAVPSGVGAPFTVHVQNGEADGSRRISSAVIAVNNVNVAVESDFSQNVAAIDRQLALGATNVLKVTLKSTPGAYLTISIRGGSVDRTAPQIALVSPAPASLTSSATPAVIIGYRDVAAPGDPGAAGLDLSSLSVSIDGVDRTSTFTRRARRSARSSIAAD